MTHFIVVQGFKSNKLVTQGYSSQIYVPPPPPVHGEFGSRKRATPPIPDEIILALKDFMED